MANLCPGCGKGELLLQQKSASVSVAGIFGAFMAVIGLVVAFFNPVIGIALIALGIVIGVVGRGKHTDAVCPLCGYRNRI